MNEKETPYFDLRKVGLVAYWVRNGQHVVVYTGREVEEGGAGGRGPGLGSSLHRNS